MSFLSHFKKPYWELKYTAISPRSGESVEMTGYEYAADEESARKQVARDANKLGYRRVKFTSARQAPELNPMKDAFGD